jgi:tRNA-specific 2-thiouridylase
MRAFLSHYIEQKQGEVVDEKGTVLGAHDGVWFHTLGERHGFTITAKSADDRPYYIVAKDIERNKLIVSHTPTSPGVVSGVQTLKLRDVNWIETIDTSKKYTAQIRYHGTLIEAKILSDREVQLAYDGLIALGQSLVIYDGEVLVGGGIIDEVV